MLLKFWITRVEEQATFPRDLADVMSPALDSGYIRIAKCIACITSNGIKAIEVYYEK